MPTFFYLTMFVALIATFVILFISKTGIRDFVVLRVKYKLIADLFECDFCLSFWIAVVLAIIISFVFNNFYYIVIPVFSAPISRKLL